MQPEATQPAQICAARIGRLADALFGLAGDQEVRVIEALAAVLTRQWRDAPGKLPRGLCEAPADRRFASAASDSETTIRRAICQRIARRALHGSLVDPTRGATAVHRIDDSPAWSLDLLPTGMFGPFLFYRPPALRRRAGDWPGTYGAGRQQIASLDG